MSCVSDIHSVHSSDIFKGWHENALMAISAIHLAAVLISDHLSHGKRDPHTVIEWFCRENQAVAEAFEAQCIFQVFVNIEQIAVIDDKVEFIPRSIIHNEVIDDLKAFAFIRDSS